MTPTYNPLSDFQTRCEELKRTHEEQGRLEREAFLRWLAAGREAVAACDRVLERVRADV